MGRRVRGRELGGNNGGVWGGISLWAWNLVATAQQGLFQGLSLLLAGLRRPLSRPLGS